MPNGEDFKLNQDQENEILSIIDRMEKNGESESNIRYVVSEFKNLRLLPKNPLPFPHLPRLRYLPLQVSN